MVASHFTLISNLLMKSVSFTSEIDLILNVTFTNTQTHLSLSSCSKCCGQASSALQDHVADRALVSWITSDYIPSACSVGSIMVDPVLLPSGKWWLLQRAVFKYSLIFHPVSLSFLPSLFLFYASGVYGEQRQVSPFWKSRFSSPLLSL